MSLILLPTIAQSRTRFSVAALDYFARVTAAGGTVTHRVPVANYIDALVALGGAYWDTMGTHCIFAGVTFPGCFVPLRSGMDVPTNFNFVSGDHNPATGLIGDSSTKYINSNLNGDSFGQNDFSMSVFVHTAKATVPGIYIATGFAGAGSSIIGRPNTENLNHRNRSSTATNAIGVGASTGYIGSSRNNSANYAFRAAGTTISITQSSQTPFNGNVNIFRSAVSPFAYSDGRLKAYHIGPAITQSVLEGLQDTLFAAIT
jgi:hypothetical protein